MTVSEWMVEGNGTADSVGRVGRAEVGRTEIPASAEMTVSGGGGLSAFRSGGLRHTGQAEPLEGDHEAFLFGLGHDQVGERQ